MTATDAGSKGVAGRGPTSRFAGKTTSALPANTRLTQQSKPRSKLLPILALTALASTAITSLGVTSANARAEEPEAREASKEYRKLTPYDAVYKTSTSGLSIKLRRSLTMDASGDCRLTSEGKLLVAGISEVSLFTLDGENIQPRSYVYQLSGPVSRRREVHFDKDSSVIRSLYKKEWYELPKTGATLDRMSQQEQLRLSLLNDPTPKDDILFHVADGRKVKEYRLLFAGEERLETPMGWVNTLHFERDHDDPDRQSGVWIAPEWDYLMVRTVHIDDGKTIEANLISADIAGTAVTGANS